MCSMEATVKRFSQLGASRSSRGCSTRKPPEPASPKGVVRRADHGRHVLDLPSLVLALAGGVQVVHVARETLGSKQVVVGVSDVVASGDEHYRLHPPVHRCHLGP